jgi:hypothetical protein
MLKVHIGWGMSCKTHELVGAIREKSLAEKGRTIIIRRVLYTVYLWLVVKMDGLCPHLFLPQLYSRIGNAIGICKTVGR